MGRLFDRLRRKNAAAEQQPNTAVAGVKPDYIANEENAQQQPNTAVAGGEDAETREGVTIMPEYTVTAKAPEPAASTAAVGVKPGSIVNEENALKQPNTAVVGVKPGSIASEENALTQQAGTQGNTEGKGNPYYQMDEETMAKLAQQDKMQRYIADKPWVAGADLESVYSQYKDLTPLQLLRDYREYKQMMGEEPTMEENLMILQGRDPYKSERQTKKEERRAYWAENLNSLGNVLAHFVNFGRAMGGNPIADPTQYKNEGSRIAQYLRQKDENLRKQHYNDYVSGLAADVKRRQAKEDEIAKQRNAIEMKQLEHQLKQYDPETQLKLKKMTQDMDMAEVRKELMEYDKKIKLARLMGIPDEQAQKKALNDINIKLKKKQLNKPEKKSTEEKLYVVGDHEFKTALEAYKYGMRQQGKEIDVEKDSDLEPEDLEEAGVTIK